MIAGSKTTTDFWRFWGIAWILVAGFSITKCSTAEIRAADLSSDLSRGEFAKYDKIADDNSNIRIIVPCQTGEIFQNNIYLSGSEVCKGQHRNSNSTFVHEKDAGDFQRSMGRAKQCHALQLEREKAFLDETGSLRKDGASTDLNVIRHSLYKIQKTCNNFDLLWKYNDPVEAAYLKEAHATFAAKHRATKSDSAKQEEIDETVKIREKANLKQWKLAQKALKVQKEAVLVALMCRDDYSIEIRDIDDGQLVACAVGYDRNTAEIRTSKEYYYLVSFSCVRVGTNIAIPNKLLFRTSQDRKTYSFERDRVQTCLR